MQRALDNIIVKYLKDEIVPEDEYGRVAKSEEDFARVLKQCLDEKGVLRELQLFLRQRLIEVLKGSLPKAVSSGIGKIYSFPALKLLEDFFCSHKLLFTYSVFGTELADNFKPKNGFGKLKSEEAEQILHEIDIRRDGNLSRAILSHYFNNDRCSLLESIILTIPWESLNSKNEKPNLSTRCRAKTPEKVLNKETFLKKTFPQLLLEGQTTFDDNLLEISLAMDKNKETVYKLEFERFKEEELEIIKDELETKMKFQMVRKEKELLENYESRMKLMKEQLEGEKALWESEKKREEEELKFHKTQLQQTIRDLKGEVQSKDQNYPEKDQIKERNFVNDVKENSPKYDVEAAKRKIAERRFLIKEAEMKVKIENLMKQKLEIENNEMEAKESPNQLNKENSDKLALLQYTIEKQAEEIKSLKTKFNSIKKKKKIEDSNFKKRPPLNSSQSSECESNTDLSRFLHESKKRCEEIENEARMVERGFKEIKSRHQNECSFYFHPPIPQIPKDENTQKHPEFKMENFPSFESSLLYNFPKCSFNQRELKDVEDKMEENFKSPPTLIPKLRHNQFVETLKQPLTYTNSNCSKEHFRTMKPNFTQAVEKLEKTLKSTGLEIPKFSVRRESEEDLNESEISILSNLGENEMNEIEKRARRKREAMEFIRNQPNFDEKRKGFENEIQKLISTKTILNPNELNPMDELKEKEGKESSEEKASKSGALIRNKIPSREQSSPDKSLSDHLDSPVIPNRKELREELLKYISPIQRENPHKANGENDEIASEEKLRENRDLGNFSTTKLDISIDSLFWD